MRDWDAATYDRVSDPQVAMAEGVLARMPLRGDERVLDAGCGSGRVTRMLLERLPRGTVVAVDASPAMVEAARAALPPQVEVLQSDLTELALDDPVDAAFSNAVFHWIPNHERLFRRLHDALRPGGRLVAQCGGKGNVERFHAVARAVGEEEPYARHLAGWVGPWNFRAPEETERALAAAGFGEIHCWLDPHPVVPAQTHEYLRTVCLGHHIERLPEELRDSYVAGVNARCGQPVELDYVRLNIDARRPA